MSSPSLPPFLLAVLKPVWWWRQVHLFSPAHTHRLGARPMYSGSANHSTLAIDPAQR